MTDTQLLMQSVNNSGLKLSFIASKMGLTYYGLRRKITNLSEFKASEINLLCDLLGISSIEEKESIFFKSQVI